MKPNDYIIENEQFKIYSDNRLKQFADEVLEINTKNITKIKELYKINDIEKINLYLFYDRDAYLNQTKTSVSYSRACITDDAIYQQVGYNDLKNKYFEYYLKRTLTHEIAHIIYIKEVLNGVSDKNKRVTWLDEGLAIYISEQRAYLDSEENMIWWVNNAILLEDKEIPPITFLKKHGTKYGEFADDKTNKYNGYEISYMLIRYIIEHKGLDYFKQNLLYKTNIDDLGQKLLNESVAYYKQQYIERDKKDKSI